MRQKKRVLRPWRWWVRKLAEEQGLSISEIARRAGVNRSTVQAFYRDPQHETTTAMWVRLSQALGVTPDQLLEPVSQDQDYL